ncbi:hypothetical protein DFP72DRAFT_838677 [Ephemerocybe angulata]|uniref:Uncharacterized protein n=1 Tax=Ephemerocybe angulata TaxID=980116 RepID=A0A8H6IK69_9AGAR|nr:hypothetical protein DFP72DRAFT_838677 [Tulosesus angulatus]
MLTFYLVAVCPGVTAVRLHITSDGSCSKHGPLIYIGGTTTKKSAYVSDGRFWIQANEEQSQMGSWLTFNWEGSFYACGSSGDIWYKLNPSEGPSDCYPVQLYAVPVI